MISKARRNGQTLLTLILLIGSIVVAVGATFAAITIATSASGYSYRASQTAETAAQAGIQDATLQLVRNGAFSSAGYSISVGSTTVTIVVSQNSPSAGYITMTSAATIANITRKLTGLFSENATTGQVSMISLQTTQ